jgi:biopolymer transport protein ExbB/TolQ
MEFVFQIISVVVYFVLVLLAVWGAFCVVLVWRRLLQTRFRSEAEQDAFLDDLDACLVEGDLESALVECEEDRRALPQLAAYAIENRNLSFQKLRRRVVERFQQDVMADIEHRLSWVATVAKAAPMVGLLGTVIGMMGAFSQIAEKKAGASPEPTAMANDIMFALITTACGRAIAVPLVLLSAGINVRIRKLEDFIDLGLGRLFETLQEGLGARGGRGRATNESMAPVSE